MECQAIWNTQTIKTQKSGGAMGSMGEEFGGSHDHYISHDAPRKTKVSTFGDWPWTNNANGLFWDLLGHLLVSNAFLWEWLLVTSHNTHVTLLTNIGQFRTCHIPCHTPCTSSTSELISPWSITITASHRLPRFLEFSPALELRYHQYWPQYYCLKFSPSSSSCSHSCSCYCPMFQHSIPVFPFVMS